MGFEPIARGPFATEPAAMPEPAGPPMPDPTWGEMLGASFETQNVVGSFFADESRPDPNRVEDGFRWDEGVADHPVYGQYSDQFALLNNSAARSALMAKIDLERENRRIIDASGVAGVVSDMAAGIIDLPSLIPGGALVRGAKGGYSVARSALMGAAAGGVGGAVAEAGLQATQATRTAEESAITIGAGIVLGGLLGGGAAALLTPVERRAAEAAATRAMDSAIDGTPLPEPVMGGEAASAGAAAVDKPTREDLTVAGAAANFAGRSVAFLTPNLRLNYSPSASVRRIGQELAENATYQAMNADGRSLGASVETLAKVSMNGKMLPAVKAVDDAFLEMRKAGGTMSRPEFEEMIGRAMRRGDVGENDFVTKAAQAVRSHLIEPLKVEAQDVRALPKDIEVATAPTYITRLWDRMKLEANEAQAKGVFKAYFKARAAEIDKAMTFEAQRRIDRIEALKAARQATGRERVSNLLAEADDITMSGLRRAESVKRQKEGVTADDLDTIGITPNDLARVVRAAKAYKPARKPTSLTQFIASKGGLVEYSGELARMGITNRTRPGFVRKTRQTPTNKFGGLDFDDAAHAAWEAGYFPNHTERPTPNEFLDALDGDFNGWGKVYQAVDEEEARKVTAIDELNEVMERLGVTDADLSLRAPKDVEDMLDKVARAMDELDRQRVEKLQMKAAEIEREITGGDYIASKTRQQQAIMRDREQAAAELLDIDNEYDGFASEATEAMFNKLTGRDAAANGVDIPDWIVPIARGPLKERTFNIPDEMVEEFLNNNIGDIMQKYGRTMSSEVELHRRFGRADMRDQIQEITLEYGDMRMKVQNAATADEARKIAGAEPGLMDGFRDWLREKRGVDVNAAGKLEITQYLSDREKADIRDVQALRDMVRGTYKHGDPTWDRVSRAVAAFNYIRLMGGAVIANMQEIFRPAMVHGLTPYFREAVGPLLSKAGREAQRMSIREAQLAGQVVEAVLNERLYTIAEMGDRLAPNTAIERLLQNSTKIASRWNGINLWTDIQKSASSILSQNRIAEGIMGESDGRFLAYLGINQDLAPRIRAQMERHAEKREGLWIANTEAWDDPSGALKRAYRAAVSKDVDSIIVTRSVGDVPLFSNGPVGRLFIQFRNFFIAAHQRVLMRGLQEDPKRFISGLVAMTAAGALVSMLRAWRGGEDRWEKWWQAAENPGYLIGEGLDMSGIFSVPMEVGNVLEKVTTFHPIKNPLKAAFPDKSQQGSSVRYASRGGVSALLGPTAALGDLALDIRARAERAAAGLNTAEQNETLVRKGVQALPFYSYPGFRETTNVLLDGTLPGFR